METWMPVRYCSWRRPNLKARKLRRTNYCSIKLDDQWYKAVIEGCVKIKKSNHLIMSD